MARHRPHEHVSHLTVQLQLTKRGIVPDPEPGMPLRDWQPDCTADLLHLWHHTLEPIEQDYAFADLLGALRTLDDPGELSPILGCDVEAFLADGDRPPARPPDERIAFLQVSNVAELSRYVAAPAAPDEPLHWMDDEEAARQDATDAAIAALTGGHPPRKIIDATGNDVLTGEPTRRRLRVGGQHGRWTPPYTLMRDFSGRSIDPPEAFALDFTPLSGLVPLPLRYDPTLRFPSDWRRDASILFATELTITFGEFLHAIFWEIGFHGSPDVRDQEFEVLRSRLDALDLEES